jgi:outer membrane autotransporter protein
MYIVAGNAGSRSNTILNAGSIQTSGANAIGTHINSGATSSAIQNTITNSGSITTTGSSSFGIRLQSVQAMGSIINSGTITTSGLGADGISVRNTSNVIEINNSGSIRVQGAARGISIFGAAAIVNSGTISAPSEAIYFDSDSSNNAANSLTILSGSVIEGGIRFNTNNLQEKLIFSNYVSANFNNAITGVNIIEATGSSQVEMNSTSALSLGSGTINVSNDASLTISSSISDITAPFTPKQTSINKTGNGLFTLNGVNTFTGGIELTSGTLALGNNQALGTGTLTMQANTTLQANVDISANNPITLNGPSTINTNGQTVSLSGVMSGLGGFNKIGNSVLELSAANTYTGNTTVSTGTLLLSGSLRSNTSVLSGATLQGGGTINGNVSNFGVIQPSVTGNPTNFTIAGSYTSTGGVFVTNLYDSQPNLIADTLTISGLGSTTTGATQIGLNNIQLLGKPTAGDGILLINTQAGAITGSNSFYYPGRIVAGAYEYRVIQGGASAPNNWYLRADNSASIGTAAEYGNTPVQDYNANGQTQQAVPQVVPVIVPVTVPITPESSQRIEVANYTSMPSLARLYMLSTVESFDQRRNDLAQANGALGIRQSKTSWGRVLGKAGELRSDDRNQGPGLNARTFAIQLGSDWYKNETGDGAKTFIGPFITLGQASGNTYNSIGSFGTGNVLLRGYSLGLNATHITVQGLYVDSMLQATRLSGVRANSILGTSINTTGWGLTASVETGWKLRVSERVSLTPQAQLIYNNTQLNDTEDLYANIGIPNDSSLTGRIGIKVAYDNISESGTDSQAWLRLSGLSTLAGRNAQIAFQDPNGVSNVAFNAQLPANWMSVDVGLNVKLSKSSQLSFLLGYDTSVTNAYKGGYGQIGLQVAF